MRERKIDRESGCRGFMYAWMFAIELYSYTTVTRIEFIQSCDKLHRRHVFHFFFSLYSLTLLTVSDYTAHCSNVVLFNWCREIIWVNNKAWQSSTLDIIHIQVMWKALDLCKQRTSHTHNHVYETKLQWNVVLFCKLALLNDGIIIIFETETKSGKIHGINKG